MATAAADGIPAPTAAQWWPRARGPLIALAVLLAAGLLFAVVRSDERHGLLDPRSSDPRGSRAVAELLRDRGVSVRVVTTAQAAGTAAGPDTTLLITDPDLLSDRQREALRRRLAPSGGRTVLLAPGTESLTALAPGVEARTSTAVKRRTPECALAAARRAGDTDLGGIRYTTILPGAEGCYPSSGLPTLLRLPAGPDGSGPGDTVLLGAPDLLFNQRLGERGNASLALQLLGSRPHLVWYLPSLDDVSAADGDRSFFELIPAGWRWGALQLGIAAVLAAVWRARRLGPLVVEPLPVSVMASETIEGHARLYHRANARDRAAAALRSATRVRLAGLVGIPRSQAHEPDLLTPAVHARLRDQGEEAKLPTVPALLFGPTPADDAELIRLADQLDALALAISSGPTHRTQQAPLPRDKDSTA